MRQGQFRELPGLVVVTQRKIHRKIHSEISVPYVKTRIGGNFFPEKIISPGGNICARSRGIRGVGMKPADHLPQQKAKPMTLTWKPLTPSLFSSLTSFR